MNITYCVIVKPSNASGKSANSNSYFNTLKLYFPLIIPYNKAEKGIAAAPKASVLKNFLLMVYKICSFVKILK